MIEKLSTTAVVWGIQSYQGQLTYINELKSGQINLMVSHIIV